MTYLDRIAESFFAFAVSFTRVWITLAVILGTLVILGMMTLAPIMGLWNILNLAIGRYVR